jgi:hypothetical protein
VTRFRLAGFFDARRLRPDALGAATLEEVATLGRPRRGALVSLSKARRCSLHRSFTKFRAPARIVMVDASGLPHSSQIKTIDWANRCLLFGSLILGLSRKRPRNDSIRASMRPHRPSVISRHGTGSPARGKELRELEEVACRQRQDAPDATNRRRPL